MPRPKSAKSPQTAADRTRVRSALREAEGRYAVAAEALGVDARTLRRWCDADPELHDYAVSQREKHGVRGPRINRREGP